MVHVSLFLIQVAPTAQPSVLPNVPAVNVFWTVGAGVGAEVGDDVVGDAVGDRVVGAFVGEYVLYEFWQSWPAVVVDHVPVGLEWVLYQTCEVLGRTMHPG